MKKYPLITSFIFGFLTSFSFTPWYLLPCGFGFSILCYQIQQSQTLKSAMIRSVVFCFGHFVSSFYWIGLAFAIDGQSFSKLLAPLPVSLLAIGFAFVVSPLIVTSWFFRSKNFYYLSFCILFVLSEFLRSYIVFGGFSWNLLGYVFSCSDALIQTASIFGVYGLSFIAIYCFSSFYYLLMKQYRQWMITCIICILVLTSSFFFGSNRLKTHQTTYKDISVRLINPFIQEDQKFIDGTDHLSNYFKLSIEGIESNDTNPIDIVIWPEASLMMPYNNPSVESRFNYDFFAYSNAILIIGGINYKKINNTNKNGYYVAMYGVDHNNLIFEYNKVHLVPFGEYIPLKKLIPFNKLTHGTEDYIPGFSNQKIVLEKFNLSIAPLICYEVIFPLEVAKAIGEDTDVIINVSNDAWYKISAQPYQHFVQAVMRSVEHGIPMLRSANHGVTAVVDPLGRVVKSLPVTERGFIDSFIPNRLPNKTLYTQYGNILLISLIISMCFIHMLLYIVNSVAFGARNDERSLYLIGELDSQRTKC